MISSPPPPFERQVFPEGLTQLFTRGACLGWLTYCEMFKIKKALGLSAGTKRQDVYVMNE